MIARQVGYDQQRKGLVIMVIAAVIFAASAVAQMAITPPAFDGTEQAQ